MNIKVKRLHPDAILPTYATDGSGCFDLYAIARAPIGTGFPVLRTGLAFEIPEDHVMLVFSRSGHGFNHDVRLANCVGVIDADYRGEIRVKLTADSKANPLIVRPGDRIAQALVIPIAQMSFTEVDELSDTTRGTGGFGSTGA